MGAQPSPPSTLTFTWSSRTPPWDLSSSKATAQHLQAHGPWKMMAIQVSILGPGPPTDRSRNPLGVGATAPHPPTPPTHTGIKISTVSIRTATHIGKDTLNGGHEAPYTGVRTPPTIAISHCPLGPGVRTFPEVRAPPPAPGCPRSHHNPPISHIAVMGPNSSHRRATLSPILAGWIISPAVC